MSRAGTIVLGFLGVLVILRPGIEAFQPAAIGVARRLVRLCGLEHRDQEADPGAEHDRDPVLDERDADVHGADRHRSVVSAASRRRSMDLGVRHRVRRHVAHYCLTNALRVADAIVVIPLDFLRIPLIAFVGWMFYGERLDLLVFAGAAHHRVWDRLEPARRDALNRVRESAPFHRARRPCTSRLDGLRFTFSTSLTRFIRAVLRGGNAKRMQRCFRA